MNRLTIKRARELRRNSTDVEHAMWNVLRARQGTGLKWRRQMPIDRYFADFACKDARLVIELDGDQHADQLDYDAERSRVIEACGYKVLRFTNHDVRNNMNGVCEAIMAEVQLATNSSPSPSHSAHAERAPPSPVTGRGVEGADHD